MLKKLAPFYTSSSSSDLPAQLQVQQPRVATRRFSADFSSPRTPDGWTTTPSLSPNVTGGSVGGYFPAQPQAAAAALGLDPQAGSNYQSEQLLARPGLQKSLRALEGVLHALDEFRELAELLQKSRKKLGKAVKELASGIKESIPKTMVERDVLYNTLVSSANLVESFADTDYKFGRAVQKSYDMANDCCAKAFKKIAREEKDHDEIMANLDFKFKRASGTYEKRMRSATSPMSAAAEHEKHISLISSLSAEMNAVKTQHGIKMRQRRDALVLDIAKSVASAAENEFKRGCEGVRRAGSYVGPLASWHCLITIEASPIVGFMPAELAMPSPLSRNSPQTISNSPSTQQDEEPPSPEQAMYSTSRPTLSNSGTFVDLATLVQHQGNSNISRSNGGSSPTQTLKPESPRVSKASVSRPVYSRSGASTPLSRPASPTYPEASNMAAISHRQANSGSLASNESGAATAARSQSFESDPLPETAGTRYASLPSDSIPAAQKKSKSDGSRHGAKAIGFVIEEADERSSPEQQPRIQRNVSIESTDSSRSFVAKMKERYLEERQRNKESALAPSSGNVATMSQRYETKSPPKQNRSRPSLPVLSEAASAAAPDHRPDHQAGYGYRSESSSRNPSISEARGKFERQLSDLPHSDHCGCANCSKAKYSGSTRASRRISLPV